VNHTQHLNFSYEHITIRQRIFRNVVFRGIQWTRSDIDYWNVFKHE